MTTPIIIPKLGNTVESCIIGLLKKKEGDNLSNKIKGGKAVQCQSLLK